MRKPDLSKLAILLRRAYLEECLTGKCECVTNEEHEKNLARAKQLGLTAK